MAITEQSKYLAFLTEKGMERRYCGENEDPEFIECVVVPRIKEELRIINKMGFAEYFLILEDICTYCRKNDIPLGPARGSAGGSVVSYCLGITEIDPLKFDLIFERFLNDERYSPPDIDTDVCWARRQDVIDYIVRKYGSDKVAQIVTFGTLSLKSLLDDLGRVYNIPQRDIDEVKSAIKEDGDKMNFAKAYEQEGFAHAFRYLCSKEPRIEKAVARLEGLHRHGSIHAGGVIIATDPIADLAPTYVPKGKGRQVVQYEMTDAETVGLLKMDLLGLRTVTHIDWAEKLVRQWYDKDFYTRGYRLDDQEAFDIINRGDTAGIFQLEGNGITAFAQRMKIESFNDIIALLALYRPGTLDSGSAEQYIKRKNGEEKVTYPHPDLEDVLKDTYGIIVYQEQVMSMFRIMAGYSLGQADMARKAMGKKKAEIMEAELDKFRAGARTKGYSEDTIEEVAGLIKTFARYGFNKSHAVAYAFLCYWTAVLKARYPDAFFTAWLNITDTADKQGWIIDHMLRSGIQLLPPDVNKSIAQFTITSPNEIRFGLQAVKGMGKTMVNSVITNREIAGPYTSYADFCYRLPSLAVDKKEALIGAGAFDFDIKHHRGELLKNARIINLYAKNKEDYSSKLIPVEPLKPMEMAELEKEIINFYVTLNPIHAIQEELTMLGGCVGIPIESLPKDPLIGGRITNVHVHYTKTKGEEMAFIEVDDGMEVFSVTIFPSDWRKHCGIIRKDVMIACRCKKGSYQGKPTLQANEIFRIDVENRDSTLVVNVGTPNALQIAQLKMLLDSAQAGKSEVKIMIIQGEYEFLLKSRLYKIKITDDMLNEINGIFGPNSVSLERK